VGTAPKNKTETETETDPIHLQIMLLFVLRKQESGVKFEERNKERLACSAPALSHKQLGLIQQLVRNCLSHSLRRRRRFRRCFRRRRRSTSSLLYLFLFLPSNSKNNTCRK
jgi:hypothetical protein